MQPQEFASYMSSACGGLLVAGSLGLLYKGVITLSQKSQEEAISIEYKKLLRVSSHYPALALFLIGWFFVGIPMVIPSAGGPTRVVVNGTIVIDPPDAINSVSVRVVGGPWGIDPDSDGSLNKELYPSMDKLKVEITSPGRIPFHKTVSVQKDGSMDVGEIQIPDPIINIRTVPAGP